MTRASIGWKKGNKLNNQILAFVHLKSDTKYNQKYLD